GGQVISNSNNGEVIATNSTTPSATGESAKSKEKTAGLCDNGSISICSRYRLFLPFVIIF
ncbi:MAG: hypothetical protein ABS965_02320, partial [Succiniclasticum sp.]